MALIKIDKQSRQGRKDLQGQSLHTSPRMELLLWLDPYSHSSAKSRFEMLNFEKGSYCSPIARDQTQQTRFLGQIVGGTRQTTGKCITPHFDKLLDFFRSSIYIIHCNWDLSQKKPHPKGWGFDDYYYFYLMLLSIPAVPLHEPCLFLASPKHQYGIVRHLS